MKTPRHIQIMLPVYVPFYTCLGCNASVAAKVLVTEAHSRVNIERRFVVNYIEDVPDNVQLATGYTAPEGWQRIDLPGHSRLFDTDGYCCGNCSEIIKATVAAALATAQTAIGLNKVNVQAITGPPLSGIPIPDPRQAIIPHEYTTTVPNAPPNTITCDICNLLENECRAQQNAISA